MRGQADLFLDYDAPLGPVETKLIDRIIIKARHQRETLKAPDHESTARMLEATGNYRVLRRCSPVPSQSRVALVRARRSPSLSTPRQRALIKRGTRSLSWA